MFRPKLKQFRFTYTPISLMPDTNVCRLRQYEIRKVLLNQYGISPSISVYR